MSGPSIGVMGSPDSWYGRDLLRAADGERIEFLSFNDLQGSLSARSLSIETRLAGRTDADTVRLTPPTTVLDGLLIRTMPLGSLEQIIFRINCLHSLARSGMSMVNPPRCLEISIDKWLTLELAQRLGIDVPRTFCCQTRRDALAAFDALGGDCVVKPIFGGEGRGMLRVDSDDLAWRVFGTLERLQSAIYVQEFLPHHGYDLRVLVIKDDLFAIRRCNDNHWRTNISQGGVAVPHVLSQEQTELAMRVVREIGGLCIGVDILPTRDGRQVLLEVNAVPGWKGTASALGVDIARRLLDLIVQMR